MLHCAIYRVRYREIRRPHYLIHYTSNIIGISEVICVSEDCNCKVSSI